MWACTGDVANANVVEKLLAAGAQPNHRNNVKKFVITMTLIKVMQYRRFQFHLNITRHNCVAPNVIDNAQVKSRIACSLVHVWHRHGVDWLFSFGDSPMTVSVIVHLRVG